MQTYSNFQLHDYPCCFETKRYYDEMKYLCLTVAKGSVNRIIFPPGQPGLFILKYGFCLALASGGLWYEQTYAVLNQFSATLKIADTAVEGYAGKNFPVSSYVEGLPNITFQTITVLNSAWLVDLAYLITQPNTPIELQVVITGTILPGTCVFARIIGKYT